MPIIHPLVTDVVPFSYRDGDTYLEILSQHEEVIDKAIRDIEEIADLLNTYSTQVETIPIEIDRQVRESTKYLKAYIKQLFNELRSNTVAESPVWGKKATIDKLLANMYNDLNIGAESAYYHDEKALRTAKDEDALGWTARRHDTYAAGNIGTTASAVDSLFYEENGTSDNPDELLGLE